MPALDQAIKILLYLQDAAGVKVSLTNICKALGLHKSKGHSILKTLQRYDIVARDPDSKAYTLGARPIPLARAVLDHLDFRSAAAPIVEELAKETGMTVWFGLAMNKSLFVVSKYEAGEHFWATPGIGQSFRLYEGGSREGCHRLFTGCRTRRYPFKSGKQEWRRARARLREAAWFRAGCR